MTLTVEERAAAGASLLDREVPGWADKVDPDLIDLQSGQDCVLGQVFRVPGELEDPACRTDGNLNGYEQGSKVLGFGATSVVRTYNLGFLEDDPETEDRLCRAWTDEVTARWQT